jgi:5-methylcytosine-specific restriction endonuclease McrA
MNKLSYEGIRGKSVIICDNCKKKFSRTNGQIKLAIKHYCSRKCQYEGMKKGSFVKCNYCGNEVWRKPSELKKYKLHYCSYKCLYKDGFTDKHKENISKANYKGAPKNQRPRNQLREWRKKIYERDNYTCQICNDRSKRGHPVILNAHHIKSFAEYPEERYDINNGMTLCRDCHLLVTHLSPGNVQ